MVIRRAVCLLLAVQMLLTQGLLCRCGAAADCQHGHGGAPTPHLHLPPLPLGKGNPKPHGCGCQHKRHKHTLSHGQGASAQAAKNQPADRHDDVFYLPELMAITDQAQRSVAWESCLPSLTSGLALLPFTLADIVPTTLALPPPFSERSSCPIFLRILTLLI